ncbi:OmpA family protein [Roseococcus sp. SYP-B2431]|uniref:OmpA family protein n=1 Tax=Roseococcus sp. SYP-B2431 TaxID=2496640 RepID=UPI00103BB84A|nr:OmpA family protein [Roseococcus sp. SYP-B2431]TCH99466.1 OmpA family protein [Roseococcus sp. SYP-B2431]
MSRAIRYAALYATGALIGATALPFAGTALAQNDPAARQLIERLRPTENQTRGIRMPGSDTGTVTAPPPTLTPAMPQAPAGRATDPKPPGVAVNRPPPAPMPQTTAPAGVAAVSITVNFATGSATLTPQAKASLASLGRALSSPELAPYRFRIEGHTDTVGDADMNMSLSQRRAEAVAEFLRAQFSVVPDRLVAVGMGESQLLVPTPDQSPESRNRRVQVVNMGG